MSSPSKESPSASGDLTLNPILAQINDPMLKEKKEENPTTTPANFPLPENPQTKPPEINCPHNLAFANKEELDKSFKEYKSKQGYQIIVANSDKEKRFLNAQCQPTKTKANEAQPTKRSGHTCPFKVTARLHKNHTWSLTQNESKHNHPPSEFSHHKDKIETQINKLTATGLKPAEILKQLQPNFPDLSLKFIINHR
ncbi:hypothetical protein PtA15_17A211 [Puccinia triticina]|uniref:FAR1 domain-containing protein n=1 Tax=Puccinia triticina TaxID=208348 RepID=A0ABY7D517_9BASI|nr:uncharacterized protein PtA15_17A211 [Puccinia triticina]WAQ92729.1 hypothetical protein PtA15_17A211 [Puccinia triticina]